MAYTGYVNKAVRAMYGIPLSQLTPKQRQILKDDGERRRKLIEERQRDFMYNNKKAFEEEEKFEKVLAAVYQDAQKKIIADVTQVRAKVEQAGGEWSYANQSALTRSRGLFEQINTELVKLGKTEETYFKNFLTEIYTDQFYRTIYTLGQSQTLKGSLNMLNPRLVEAALNYPWSGAMFSDRLWLDKERLGKNLRWGLTQSMVLGEGIPEMTKRINNGIETSKYNAERVARTETKRVTYSSQSQAFAEQGVKEVRYMAANNGGDARTCDLCREDHNKVYKLGDEPTLPRHPNCRCWYVPVVSDTFEDNELNELTGSVRGAENYEKWKQAQEAQAVKEGEAKPTTETVAKSDKVIQLESEKRGIQAQIDAKNLEYKQVADKYATQISHIEQNKAKVEADLPGKSKQVDDLTIQYENNKQQRRTLRTDHREGLISDSEYDKRFETLLEEQTRVKQALDLAEEEYYSMWNRVNSYRDELSKIQKQIEREQRTIKWDIDSLSSKIQKIDGEILQRMKYPGKTDAFIEIMQRIEANRVEANLVKVLPEALTDDEIIDRIAGGDLTKGSCASLGWAYVGNKHGLDVLDFRDGKSRSTFASWDMINSISELKGVKATVFETERQAKDTAKFLTDTLKPGKEYYLGVGKHAAIVRATEQGLEYLELQSGYGSYKNGWHSFNTYGDTVTTLAKRFGCRKTVEKIGSQVYKRKAWLIEVDSLKGNDEFREILSYINTEPGKQRKGSKGTIK